MVGGRIEFQARLCAGEVRGRGPEDVDPAELVSLIFPYVDAYQMLPRTARVMRGETVLVPGAAGP